MAISALSSSTTPVTTTSATSTTSTATKASNGTVASAVNLASNANLVSLIGGGGGSTATFSATGVLNSILDAGTTSVTVPSVGTDTSQVAQLANDAGVVDTLTTSTSASGAGVYKSSSSLQNLSDAVTATYSDILSTNPGLASSFVGASYNAGIVSTINTTA